MEENYYFEIFSSKNCLIFIIFSAIAALFWVFYAQKNNKLQSNKNVIQLLPSIISTLGVLGTFWGITMGLLQFDPEKLDDSIPNLLDGLKTAFFTSLAGMIGSMILSAIVNKFYDTEETDKPSSTDEALANVCKAIKGMDASVQSQNSSQTSFYNTLLSKLDQLQSIPDSLGKMLLHQQSVATSVSSVKDSLRDMLSHQQSIDASVLNMKNSVEQVNKTLDDSHDSLDGIANINQEQLEETKKFSQVLRDEVTEIEEKMADSNALLERKFDEFTELLKKSNTEALVEVMKNVTKEFQEQMNALINKLVQENFEQLNKSVERLNTWQEENKEMIQSLTKQYKEMAENFEGTSTTLKNVGNDTQALVSDGGKLRQIVDALNEVIVKDEHFIEITKNLTETVNMTKDNMEMFDQATSELNNWVKKQKNFVEGVQMLIEKLDELQKIRDYGEQFWQDTKRGMEAGVNIIKSGSVQLQNQLTNLDQQFYNRLNATLAELDTCIQAMVNGKTQNR